MSSQQAACAGESPSPVSAASIERIASARRSRPSGLRRRSSRISAAAGSPAASRCGSASGSQTQTYASTSPPRPRATRKLAGACSHQVSISPAASRGSCRRAIAMIPGPSSARAGSSRWVRWPVGKKDSRRIGRSSMYSASAVARQRSLRPASDSSRRRTCQAATRYRRYVAGSVAFSEAATASRIVSCRTSPSGSDSTKGRRRSRSSERSASSPSSMAARSARVGLRTTDAASSARRVSRSSPAR